MTDGQRRMVLFTAFGRWRRTFGSIELKDLYRERAKFKTNWKSDATMRKSVAEECESLGLTLFELENGTVNPWPISVMDELSL